MINERYAVLPCSAGTGDRKLMWADGGSEMGGRHSLAAWRKSSSGCRKTSLSAPDWPRAAPDAWIQITNSTCPRYMAETVHGWPKLAVCHLHLRASPLHRVNPLEEDNLEGWLWSHPPSSRLASVCASEKGVTVWLVYFANWFLLEASEEDSRNVCSLLV